MSEIVFFKKKKEGSSFNPILLKVIEIVSEKELASLIIKDFDSLKKMMDSFKSIYRNDEVRFVRIPTENEDT